MKQDKIRLTIVYMGIIILTLIGIVSALDLQSGETYQIDLGIPYTYYTIVGNLAPVEIDITLNGTIASITPNKYMESDSFDIIFYAEEKVIEVPVYIDSGGGGGSGGSKKTVYVNKTIDNTVYVDREVEKIINETEVCPILNEEIDKNYLWMILNVVGLFVIILFLYLLLLKKREKGWQNQ